MSNLNNATDAVILVEGYPYCTVKTHLKNGTCVELYYYTCVSMYDEPTPVNKFDGKISRNKKYMNREKYQDLCNYHAISELDDKEILRVVGEV